MNLRRILVIHIIDVVLIRDVMAFLHPNGCIRPHRGNNDSGCCYTNPATHKYLGRTVLLGGSSNRANHWREGGEAWEAIQSLNDFHQGQWRGQARSFSITTDVAAGIIQRSNSCPYEVTVRVEYDDIKHDYVIRESFQWDTAAAAAGCNGNGNTTTEKKLSSRILPVTNCNMDVDVVDASYSLDATLPDLPSIIIGTEKLQQFMVESCIATGNHRRSRCMAFYGVNQQIIRIVVCEEERRVPETPSTHPPSWPAVDIFKSTRNDDVNVNFSAVDIPPFRNDYQRVGDMDQSKLKSFMPSGILGQHSKEAEDENSLFLHPINLLELSSGIWSGDSIVRDIHTIPVVPLERTRLHKGFGTNIPNRLSTTRTTPFASWSMGVQKVARQWVWNLGEEIRVINEFGKAMGAELSNSLTRNQNGLICVNEKLSRRIPVEDRMVYIDWGDDNVGFLLGAYSIQVPRFLTFQQPQKLRSFRTEFCVYQFSSSIGRNSPSLSVELQDGTASPNLCCSKIDRVYTPEGKLYQGCTSFYQLTKSG